MESYLVIQESELNKLNGGECTAGIMLFDKDLRQKGASHSSMVIGERYPEVIDIIKSTPMTNTELLAPFRRFFQNRLSSLSSSTGTDTAMEQNIYNSIAPSTGYSIQEELSSSDEMENESIKTIELYINTMLSYTIFINIDGKTRTKYTEIAKSFNKKIANGLVNICSVPFSLRIPEIVVNPFITEKILTKFKETFCSDIGILTEKIIDYVISADTSDVFGTLLIPKKSLPPPIPERESTDGEDIDNMIDVMISSVIQEEGPGPGSEPGPESGPGSEP